MRESDSENPKDDNMDIENEEMQEDHGSAPSGSGSTGDSGTQPPEDKFNFWARMNSKLL